MPTLGGPQASQPLTLVSYCSYRSSLFFRHPEAVVKMYWNVYRTAQELGMTPNEVRELIRIGDLQCDPRTGRMQLAITEQSIRLYQRRAREEILHMARSVRFSVHRILINQELMLKYLKLIILQTGGEVDIYQHIEQWERDLTGKMGFTR